MKYTEEEQELIELGKIQNEKTMMMTQNMEKQQNMVNEFKKNILFALKCERNEKNERIQTLKIMNRKTDDEEIKKENNLEIEVLKLQLQKIKFNKNFFQIEDKIRDKKNELTIVKMERIHKKDKLDKSHEKN